MHMRSLYALATAVVMAFVGTGCGLLGGTTSAGGTVAPAPPVPKPLAKPKASAGVEVATDTDISGTVEEQAKNRNFATRTDAFQLLPEEVKFDKQQFAARFSTEGGGFAMFYEEPEESVDEIIIEPVPAWRLSAVMVGDGVAAVLVQDDSREGTIIKPGQKIEGTDWVVASIDKDRAILRRKGPKFPREIVVNLKGAKARAQSGGMTGPGGMGLGGPAGMGPAGMGSPRGPAGGGPAGAGIGGA